MTNGEEYVGKVEWDWFKPMSKNGTPQWKLRVVDEHKELSQRIIRLHAFIISDKFQELSFTEQKRLREQFKWMGMYADVLTERIRDDFQ